MGYEEIEKAKAQFMDYKKKDIILNDSFDDDTWKFCDEYANLGMRFDFAEMTYQRCYEEIFGIDVMDMKLYLKAFIALSIGKNVLNTIRDALNDTKRLFNTLPDNITDTVFIRPKVLFDFIELISAVDTEAKDNILEQLEICTEIKFDKQVNNRRNLAQFDSYFRFDELLDSYWQGELNVDERLFYYPIYLWWKITSILPLRPREFLLTPRDCLSQKEDKYYLTIRRNQLKGRQGNVHYKLEGDYRKETYPVPQKLHFQIEEYIRLTAVCPDNDIGTLFRAEPHYRMFHHVKPYTSRFYTYINLMYCLKSFFIKVLKTQMDYTIIPVSDEKNGLAPKEIEYFHLGDTRHIAMINLIMQGGTPTLAMLLAGHADITMSSHYYSNIASLVACKTYSMFRKRLSNGQNMILGRKFYAPNISELDYVSIENGSRCYSPRLVVGDIADCLKAVGDKGEIGYCYRCPYFRKTDATFFSETEDIYTGMIDRDSNYLKAALNKYRSGLSAMKRM